jgi:hypothetical protein
MTVYLVISLPKIPYMHRIHMVLTNPAYLMINWACRALLLYYYTSYTIIIILLPEDCLKLWVRAWPLRGHWQPAEREDETSERRQTIRCSALLFNACTKHGWGQSTTPKQTYVWPWRSTHAQSTDEDRVRHQNKLMFGLQVQRMRKAGTRTEYNATKSGVNKKIYCPTLEQSKNTTCTQKYNDRHVQLPMTHGNGMRYKTLSSKHVQAPTLNWIITTLLFRLTPWTTQVVSLYACR